MLNTAALTVRTQEPIALKAGVTLVDVLEAFGPFMARHSVDLHEMLDPDEVDFGSLPMSLPRDSIRLTEGGLLSFEMEICADSTRNHFGEVDMRHLLAGPGTVEQINAGSPSGAPTHLSFLGATPEQQVEAGARYESAKNLGAMVHGAGYSVCERSGARDAEFFGPVLAIGALHVAQDIGRRQAVIHAIDRLDRQPVLGERIGVKFKDGRGIVSGMSMSGQDLGR